MDKPQCEECKSHDDLLVYPDGYVTCSNCRDDWEVIMGVDLFPELYGGEPEEIANGEDL